VSFSQGQKVWSASRSNGIPWVAFRCPSALRWDRIPSTHQCMLHGRSAAPSGGQDWRGYTLMRESSLSESRYVALRTPGSRTRAQASMAASAWLMPSRSRLPRLRQPHTHRPVSAKQPRLEAPIQRNAATRAAFSAITRALFSSRVPAGSPLISTVGLDHTGMRGQPPQLSL
jgi:hypothetical protein